LLGKNPNRLQSFSVAFGQVHVFYPVAREEQCTVALLMDVDPIGLVRGRRGSGGDAGLLTESVGTASELDPIPNVQGDDIALASRCIFQTKCEAVPTSGAHIW